MQFEQPPELNRYVDATIPLTWAVRRRALRPVLPMLVCCSALLVEQVVFRLWLNDRSLVRGLPLLFVCALLPIALITLAYEVQIRIMHRSKRRLGLGPKRICFSPAKHKRIGLSQVTAWRLDPLPKAVSLLKLTVEYSLGKRAKKPREWSMALRLADQESAFLSELEHYRRKGLNSAPLVRVAPPASSTPPKRRVRSMMAAAVGLFLLLHGMPLLGVGLLPPQREANQTSTSRFTQKETGKLKRFVRQTFTSQEAFRNFLLGTGGGLTLAGAGLYFWGLSTPKRSDELESVRGLGAKAARAVAKGVAQ